MYVESDNIYEMQTRYDLECSDHLQPQWREKNKGKGKCIIKLDRVEHDIPGPLFVYYGVDNYFQNHRRYLKSRSLKQLNGQWQEWSDLGDCDPVIKVSDLWEHQQTSVSN